MRLRLRLRLRLRMRAHTVVGICKSAEPEERCPGGQLCMHDCYEELSADAMRAEVEFEGVSRAPPASWRSRLLVALENRVHPLLLRDFGVGPELLAYCGITIDQLVERPSSQSPGVVTRTVAEATRYPLAHVIEAFELTFADLRLLGFRLTMLAKKQFYPLIVLYDQCAFRADTLFAFEIGYGDVKNFLLDVDARYAELLRLNLPWWQSALTQTLV